MRKERGELKLAKYKLEGASLEMDISRRRIENKMGALLEELESSVEQIRLSEEIVESLPATPNGRRTEIQLWRKFTFPY